MISSDVRRPLIHGGQLVDIRRRNLIGRRLVLDDHLVGGGTVGRLEPGTHDERPLRGVDVVAESGEVQIGALVDDRRRAQAEGGAVDQVVGVCGPQRSGVGGRPLGRWRPGVVLPADLRVQLGEFGRRQLPRLQRGKPVLDAGVVQGAADETGLRVAPELVDQLFVRTALDPGRVGHRIPDGGDRDSGVAALGGRGPAGEGGIPGAAGTGGRKSFDRQLRGGTDRSSRTVEEGVEQPTVGDRPEHGQRIWEGDAGNDAVEDARILVGDVVLLDRPPEPPQPMVA